MDTALGGEIKGIHNCTDFLMVCDAAEINLALSETRVGSFATIEIRNSKMTKRDSSRPKGAQIHRIEGQQRFAKYFGRRRDLQRLWRRRNFSAHVLLCFASSPSAISGS